MQEQNALIEEQRPVAPPDSIPNKTHPTRKGVFFERLKPKNSTLGEASKTEHQQTNAINRGGSIMDRRRFLRSALRSTAALAGGAIIKDGLDVSANPLTDIANIDQAEKYATQEGDVRLILGNHHTGKPYEETHDKYVTTGNLNLTIWSRPSLKIIDESMRDARKNGASQYYCIVDGISYDVSSLYWPLIPHPADLFQRNEYPQEIYIIGADIPFNFGLSAFMIPDYDTDPKTKKQFDSLLQEMSDWYDSDSINRQELNRGNKLVDQDIIGGIAGTALIGTAVMGGKDKMTRRRFLNKLGLTAAAVGTVAGIEATKGMAQHFGFDELAGNSSNATEQRILTSLDDIAGKKSTDDASGLWMRARTALAAEKSLEARSAVPSYDSAHQGKIDMLYGSDHALAAERIMTDPDYRISVIKEFTNDLLTKIDEALTYRYEELLKHRGTILKNAASSLTNFETMLINMPWGERSVDPNMIGSFESGLIGNSFSGYSESVNIAVGEVLRNHFNIDINNPLI